MRRTVAGALLLLIGYLASPSSTDAQAPLIVHEWGTLTTRHAPDGQPQGRLNRIDASDVLPDFVHRFEPVQVGREDGFGKSTTTPGRPEVTMRLETPVLYFYGAGREPFDVRVQLRGGILNEFYPRAEPSVVRDEGRLRSKFAARILGPTDSINLDNYLLGTLAWNGVSLDTTARVPQTDAVVWTAPRNVGATSLVVSGEGEHYLFYRGVAHLDALIRTSHSPTTVRLSAPQNLSWMPDDRMAISRVWLVDVRADLTVAFETLGGLVVHKSAPSAPLAEVKRGKWEYSGARTSQLRQSMKGELLRGGLFDDEAEAMLATWNASYFQKPGLRLFYTVPREWIAHFLPLELSIPHEATRVLIGRIDLVSAN